MTISPDQGDWVPSACTLPTVEQPIRVAEFDRFFTTSARTTRRPNPARLEVVVDPGTETLARELAGRESSCCSFFVFDFTATAEGLVMGVGVPPTYIEVLDAFAELTAVRDTLAAALAAGCEDLLACSESPSCPVRFDMSPATATAASTSCEGGRCGC
ncbi:hypothetical protein ABZV91_29375 [Nocardia sp. NPDC004568]|uniref:hypothetical protein n=1 Tax=Nocardia sp. NPDC004568 TaxID=3154551 RepID=UPI0033B2A618